MRQVISLSIAALGFVTFTTPAVAINFNVVRPNFQPSVRLDSNTVRLVIPKDVMEASLSQALRVNEQKLKDTKFNRYTLKDTQAKMKGDLLEIGGVIRVEHRELIAKNPFTGKEHFSPWVSVSGRITQDFGVQIKNNETVVHAKGNPRIEGLQARWYAELVSLAGKFVSPSLAPAIRDQLKAVNGLDVRRYAITSSASGIASKLGLPENQVVSVLDKYVGTINGNISSSGDLLLDYIIPTAQLEALKNVPATVASKPSTTSQSQQFSTIYFKNNCPYPLQVAVHFRDLNNQWQTKAWYSFAPNEKAARLGGVETKNRYIYYYGETTDGSNLVWNGNFTSYINDRLYDMQEINTGPNIVRWTQTLNCPRASIPANNTVLSSKTVKDFPKKIILAQQVKQPSENQQSPDELPPIVPEEQQPQVQEDRPKDEVQKPKVGSAPTSKGDTDSAQKEPPTPTPEPSPAIEPAPSPAIEPSPSISPEPTPSPAIEPSPSVESSPSI